MRKLRPVSLLALAAILLPLRPLSAVTPAELAPPDTLFYCEVPSVALFYEFFLQYHATSVLGPMVAKVMATKVATLIAERSPEQFTVPLAFDANAALFSVVETDQFIASVMEPSGALTFVCGGVTPAPEQSVAKLRTMLEAKVPGLTWRNETIEKSTVAVSEITGIGPIYLTNSGTWLLFGTSRSALEHSLRAIAQPIPGLSSTDLWKISVGKRPANTQLFYFSRLEKCAEIAAKQKRPDIEKLFQTRLAGLRAFSWAWGSAGAGALAADHMNYTLTPETAKAFGSIVKPLGTGWRPLAGPNTTTLTVFKFDGTALSAAPILKEFAIVPLLEAGSTFLNKDASPVHAAWIADFDPETQQPMSAVAVRADEKSVRDKLAAIPEVAAPRGDGYVIDGKAFASFKEGTWFLTQTEVASTYFQNRKPGPSPVILDQMDKMPATADAFLDIRLDRQAAVRNYASRLKKNYAIWEPLLTQSGVEMPKTLPDIDYASYVGPVRCTLGLNGDNLEIHNTFLLGKSTGSTMFTAISQVLEVAYRPQFVAAFEKCDQLLSAEADRGAPSLFSVCLKTNFLVSAIFEPNRNSLFDDIFSACFFAVAPDLKE